MTLEIDRLPQAIEDLDDIWLHIARDSMEAADRIARQVYAAEDHLAEFPALGRARPEIGPGLRHWPVGEYLIFYRVDDQRLTVVRLLHGRRDLRSQFNP